MCTRSGGAIEAGQGSRFVIVYFNSESGSFFPQHLAPRI
jgi:hypothetical protein